MIYRRIIVGWIRVNDGDAQYIRVRQTATESRIATVIAVDR